MANENDNKTAVSSAAGMPKKDEPVIHVIPARFYGAALKKQLPPEPAPVAASKPVTPPMPPRSEAARPPVLPPGPAKSAAGKKFPLIPVIIIAAVLLIGGGIAAYVFLSPKQVPPVNTNAPIVACGDAKCDASENPENCPSDCKAPGPTCGDTVCETPESSATCAIDCPAPITACGDAKCDDGENATSCPADCQTPVQQPVSGADSDSDGLTDVEERDIYRTNPLASNTDGDSFVDLNEVLNLFDPAKPSPAALRDSAGIAQFADAQSFSATVNVLYPRAWSAAKGTGIAVSDEFIAPTGEKISLSSVANPEKKPLGDVFASTHPSILATDVQHLATRSGYAAAIGPDRMEAYIQAPDGTVYSLTYVLGTATTLQYKVTFEMMMNSFLAISL